MSECGGAGAGVLDVPVDCNVHDVHMGDDAGIADPQGLLRIGQLANATGESTKTLRFYDDAGVLVASARSPAGYRLYAPAMVDRVVLVRAGQAAGLCLEEIGALFAAGRSESGGTSVDVAEVLARIEATRDNLARLERWISERFGRR